MSRVTRTAAAALLALCLAPALAAAERITVKVVDAAGGTVYLEPGRAAGILPKATLRLGNHDYVVTEVTEKTCAIHVDGVVVQLGEAGTVEATPGAASRTQQLPKPHALEEFKDQWPAAAHPADGQEPKRVPLGGGRAPGRAHVTVIAQGMGSVDKSGVDGQAEARVVSSFELMSDRPLAADLDLAIRGFAAGWNTPTRQVFFARAAALRYGDAADPRFAVGRLRYAAAAVGMLDGARVAARVGAYQIAAFGGLVPDPVSGRPDTGAARFGAEASYDDPTAPWQPHLALTAHGSTWQGAVDERRLSMYFSAGRHGTFMSGWAEAQSFASDNPFGADALEITGAGASAEYRHGATHVGFDLTFLRPERSLRLLSAFAQASISPDWLCTRTAQAAGAMAEPCTGGDYWAAATGSAGWRGGAWSVDAVGSIGQTHSLTDSTDLSGYLRTAYHSGSSRYELGGSSGRSATARWLAAEIGWGMNPSRRTDLVLRYRPEFLDYRALTTAEAPILLHSVTADLRFAKSAEVDLGVSAIGTTGADRDALVMLTTLAWRPLP
jgi:hypothetical protein